VSDARVVVVTGGAKGIGLSVVQRFAAAGDRVIALGRDKAALDALEQQTFVCDVTDEDAVRATFAAVGPVDVLVNNAGISASAPLAKTTLQSWRHHMDVNATGAFLCMREVIDGMRKRDSGVIVTVASVAGRIGAPYISAYVASKHAVIGLTRAAASEVAGSGVRVNAVCPGYVRTEMTERTVANIVSLTGRDEGHVEDLLVKMSPLGRLLEPDEVADAVVYLCSPAAAAINGQSLLMDGGGIQA
jgi:NAD(P)-dependent dehydrogenase (short-subunit alcohol dehydrogenase family)